jgi:hypothetical protein
MGCPLREIIYAWKPTLNEAKKDDDPVGLAQSIGRAARQKTGI